MKAVALSLLLLLPSVSVVLATETPADPTSTDAMTAPSSDERPGVTPSGATFTIPAGWREAKTPHGVVLRPPEGDLVLGIVDVKARDADAAVAAAWALHQPGFARKLRLATDGAPRNGWAATRTYEYETSPNERRLVMAIASRAGEQWLVAMLDGSLATFEKRNAPLTLVRSSLRPQGHARESFAGREPATLDARKIEILKQFARDGMRKLQVPGVGLALIDDGKVAWAGGLGVRELGKPAPVDGDTRFIAASNTKALTTLLLAQLVDDGKLAWEQPVTAVYPAFKLGSAEATAKTKVKHLVCACTGMPRQDYEWLYEPARHDPASTLTLLGTMQPTTGFGEVFQYSNPMASAAGYIAGAIDSPGMEVGAAYDAAMQRRVFGPLGMVNTTFDFAKAQAGNHARPHDVDVDGTTRVGSMALNDTVVPIRPAGGVWTSANDLARYIQLELADGKLPNGDVLVSRENLRARWAKQVMVGEGFDYGMGLFAETRLGVTMIGHGGDLAGYHSMMMWMPEHGIGLAVLTNGEHGYALREPLRRRLLELLFDGRPEAQAQLDAAAAAIAAERKTARAHLALPAAPAPSRALARRYRSDALGDLVVQRRGEHVFFDLGEWGSTVGSRRNEDGTVSFITVDPNLQGHEFVVGERDGRRVLVVRDRQHEYVFVAQPDAA